ncbi:MAG: DsrE family protein [Desulfobulbaceae bacterium]|nr:DsrE family protein [Desulfobulbaceae bacterium]
MKCTSPAVYRVFVLSVLLSLLAAAHASGGEYEALNGVNNIKAVFDVRANAPKTVWIYLDLIHKTFKDRNIKEITDKPEFAVVFIGPAVKLISTNTEGFTAEEKEMIGKIAATVSAMASDGIKLEICMYAANLMGVDPASILPEIKQVENGWISMIGLQARGYALVPAY